jgi:PAT family beta-lactamase induction signal transducer AmpG
MSESATAAAEVRPTVAAMLADRRLWLMTGFGFASGLPLPLSGFTLRYWLADGGVGLKLIGLTASIGLAYSLKFLWSPVFDTAARGPLARLGRRRGWLRPSSFYEAVVVRLGLVNQAETVSRRRD